MRLTSNLGARSSAYLLPDERQHVGSDRLPTQLRDRCRSHRTEVMSAGKIAQSGRYAQPINEGGPCRHIARMKLLGSGDTLNSGRVADARPGMEAPRQCDSGLAEGRPLSSWALVELVGRN